MTLQLPENYDSSRIQIMPHSLKGPYINRLISLTANKLVFDGYFRIEEQMLPVDRVLYLMGRKREFHIYITAVRRGENTSTYSYDEDVGEHICLTPSEIVELTFRVMPEKSGKEIDALIREIDARENTEEFSRASWEERKAINGGF